MLDFVALKNSFAQPGHDPYTPQDAPKPAPKMTAQGSSDLAPAPNVAAPQQFRQPARAGLPPPDAVAAANDAADPSVHEVVVRAPPRQQRQTQAPTRAGPLPSTTPPVTGTPYTPPPAQRPPLGSQVRVPQAVQSVVNGAVSALQQAGERVGRSQPAQPSTAGPRSETRLRDGILDQMHDGAANAAFNFDRTISDMPRGGRINPDSARPTPRAGLDIVGGARRLLERAGGAIHDLMNGDEGVHNRQSSDAPLAPGAPVTPRTLEREPMGRARIPPAPVRPSINRQPAEPAGATPVDFYYPDDNRDLGISDPNGDGYINSGDDLYRARDEFNSARRR